jgi:C4-dicarboxylate-specific signal transduction histidine kinase
LAQRKLELVRTTNVAMMGEFTALFAHEIQQPLAAIVANGDYCLRLLENNNPELWEIQGAIVDIVSDGNRASSMISRIRAMLAKGTPDWAELNIHELIRGAVSFVQRELDDNNVDLQIESDTHLPSLFGDRVQLQQVLINVLMNGIEAMRPILDRPRQFIIKSAMSAEGMRIQVRDSGPGFESAAADRLFEPFFTTKPEALGLGLSISRSIMESHGGHLRAISVCDGALFEFTVPAGVRESR